MTKSKIVNEVIDDLNSRVEAGLKEYGVTVDRKDYSEMQWLEELYNELLDAAVYTKRIMILKGKNADEWDTFKYIKFLVDNGYFERQKSIRWHTDKIGELKYDPNEK